jgi:hypothetical protein
MSVPYRVEVSLNRNRVAIVKNGILKRNKAPMLLQLDHNRDCQGVQMALRATEFDENAARCGVGILPAMSALEAGVWSLSDEEPGKERDR